MAASYIDFVEERLEIGIDYGVVGGHSFKTEIIENGAGIEYRNALWWQPLGRWQLGDRMLLDSNIEGMEEVKYLREFHFSRQGSKQGFRFKDWCDYRVEGQIIGTTNGLTRQWQLKKSYTAGSHTTYRPILKPVEGTVKLYLDGEEISYALINCSNGIVSFAVPPEPSQILTADFEFDVPVQFEADKVEWTLKAVELQTGEYLHKLGSVFVKEIRINPDLEWYHRDPIPKLIRRKLILGIIPDSTEVVRFSTRSEVLSNSFTSSISDFSSAKTMVKVPTRNFDKLEYSEILNYFWVAKGRLSLFYLELNNKTYLCRFSVDSLSAKFQVTNFIDSLLQVSGLDFLELSNFNYNLLLGDVPTVYRANSIVNISGQARSSLDFVGMANLELSLQFDFGVEPQTINFTTDENGFFSVRLQTVGTLTHPDRGKLVIRNTRSNIIDREFNITTSPSSIPFSLNVPQNLYSNTNVTVSGAAPAGQTVVLQCSELAIDESLTATAAGSWSCEFFIDPLFPTTQVTFTLNTEGFSQLVENRTVRQLSFNPVLGIQNYQYN